jgi:hypothetical protein
MLDILTLKTFCASPRERLPEWLNTWLLKFGKLSVPGWPLELGVCTKSFGMEKKKSMDRVFRSSACDSMAWGEHRRMLGEVGGGQEAKEREDFHQWGVASGAENC